MNSIRKISPREAMGALFCLLALAFPFVWFVTDGSVKTINQALLLLFLVFFFERQEIRKNSLVVFCLAFSLLLYLEYLWQYVTVPDHLFGGRPPSNYAYFFSFFLVLSYGTIVWKRIDPFYLLAGAFLGLVFFLVLHDPEKHWLIYLSGERVNFGFRNAQHAGIFFGTAFLCILFFGFRVGRLRSSPLRLMALGGIVSCAALMLFGVVATQTRAVWLGLLGALLTAAVLALMTGGLQPVWIWVRRPIHAIPLLLAAVIAAVLFAALDVPKRVTARLAQEEIGVETLREAARFDERAQLSSSGARIALWRAAPDWIAERPVFGWGVFSAKKLIAADERFTPEFKAQFGHLHNSYIEALVAVGIVGFAGMLAIVGSIGRSVYVAWQEGAMPRDVFLFSWAFLVFWGVVNSFESYINYKTGFYLNSVIFGFIYAFYLQRPAASPRKEAEQATRADKVEAQ